MESANNVLNNIMYKMEFVLNVEIMLFLIQHQMLVNVNKVLLLQPKTIKKYANVFHQNNQSTIKHVKIHALQIKSEIKLDNVSPDVLEFIKSQFPKFVFVNLVLKNIMVYVYQFVLQIK